MTFSSGDLSASSLINYSYYSSNLTRVVKNSSTCLTCKKKPHNDTLDVADICLMAAPQIMTLEPHYLTAKLCREKSCYEFESKPFCAVSLSVENKGIGGVKFVSGQNCSTKTQSANTTIDLICPQHFTLSSIVERKVMDDFNLTSNCIVCKPNQSLNRELLITMCLPAFTPVLKHEMYKFTYMKYHECDQEDESKCEIGVPKKIHDGLYCGSKLGPEPLNTEFLRFDYKPCETENVNQSKVKICFVKPHKILRLSITNNVS
jgi:hypothetical protein